jgi:hypothetical protein
MLLRNKTLFIIPVLILAISCSKTKPKAPESGSGALCNPPPPTDTSNCSAWHYNAGVASISGANTATAGQNVQLTVVMIGNNGCADSANITANTTGNNITLTGNVHYQGCICTQALIEIPYSYTFTPAQTGTYTFHGVTPDGTALTHTILVQ